MATGRNTQLTKQVGEYLVAAELCRRGLIATTFTGNVPHYDIIASNEKGKHHSIQVKTINSKGSWQLDLRRFAEIRLEGEKQIIDFPTKSPVPDLVYVFVRLQEYGTDDFYVIMWDDLQRMIITNHRAYLKKHGGKRPKKFDSFHTAIGSEKLEEYRDNWDIMNQI
ncbi:MAG: hypothetical protein CL946_06225 [Ectothiorhodospiraceae bacterium]|nr:hypothetical protein [Ectothiorhodospiraceae bacterium]